MCQADKTKQDVKSKDLQIRKMEETIHGLDSKMKEKDQKNKTLQDKVDEFFTYTEFLVTKTSKKLYSWADSLCISTGQRT